MTHRFDDDGGDEYDSEDWQPGSHKNPSLLSSDEPQICPYCYGKGKIHGFDSNLLKKTGLEKCKPCEGFGYR